MNMMLNPGDRFPSLTVTPPDGPAIELPSALAGVMGGRNVALMRGPGSVACGPTLQTAVFRAVYTEVSARIQHWTMALAGGKAIAALDTEEGKLADVINRTAGMRAWDLWRTQVRNAVGW